MELSQLKQRALTGELPDGGGGKPVDSTRWLNNGDMLDAIKQAQAKFATTGETRFEIDMGKVVGDGYYQNTTTYAKATTIKVILNAQGLPTTAFPVLP